MRLEQIGFSGTSDIKIDDQDQVHSNQERGLAPVSDSA